MLQKVSICGVDTTGLPKLSHKENEELMRRLKAGEPIDLARLDEIQQLKAAYKDRL